MKLLLIEIVKYIFITKYKYTIYKLKNNNNKII